MQFGGSWFVVRGSWFVVVVFYVPTVLWMHVVHWADLEGCDVSSLGAFVRTTDRAGRAPTRPICDTRPMGGWASFSFSARAGWAGVVLRYMPGRAGGRSVFRPGARGRRPVFYNFTESRSKKPNSDFNGLKGNLGIIENSVALPVLCSIRRTTIASFQIKKTMQIECS